MAKSISLSIYLVKSEFTAPDQIISPTAPKPLTVPIAGQEALLYVKSEHEITPKWVRLFSGVVDASALGKASTISAALVINVAGRYFVLTFGIGGRFLMQPDVYEERFGLTVALNSVAAESIRVIDKQSLDIIESHSRIQAGYATTADEFGLDVEQDMLRSIVGAPRRKEHGSRMVGSEALGVSVQADLPDIPGLLQVYKKSFERELDRRYEWVNNISVVKSNAAVVPLLEGRLVEKLQAENYANIWLSIPEVIDWTQVAGFTYTGGRGLVHPDINLNGFLRTVEPGSLSIELLKRRRVKCVDADHRPVFKDWQVFKCLYAEIDHHGRKYILNAGAWFRVNLDFVEQTNARFDAVPYAHFTLPLYPGGGETAYNKSVADAHPGRFFLLDADMIPHGGGRGRVEACDLLSCEKHLIHIKQYGKSSMLSHLFAQGFISGQLIQVDGEFRKKVIAKLKPPFSEMLSADRRPAADEFTIVYGIISDSEGEKLNLPFFSRVNLNNTAKTLRGLGYKVELLKVRWEEETARTARAPPNKRKR